MPPNGAERASGRVRWCLADVGQMAAGNPANPRRHYVQFQHAIRAVMEKDGLPINPLRGGSSGAREWRRAVRPIIGSWEGGSEGGRETIIFYAESLAAVLASRYL